MAPPGGAGGGGEGGRPGGGGIDGAQMLDASEKSRYEVWASHMDAPLPPAPVAQLSATRGPQSWQSVHGEQMWYSLPTPPSSQSPSEA